MNAKQKVATIWCLGVAPLLFLSWIAYTPIPYLALKLAAVGCLVLPVLGLTFGLKSGKWVGAALLLFFAVLAFWPAKSPDPQALRTQYVSSLISYRNTPYVWGGENGRGIDCSGLMRRGMVDALLAEGWRRKDPAQWRRAASIWWCDCSAREMKNGYSGAIMTRFQSRRLNDVDASKLQPGDLAVMKSGVHILAYIGDKTWIQADPSLANGCGKVIETTVPSRSGWFEQGVVICRWKSLA